MRRWAFWTVKTQIRLVGGGSPDNVIKSYTVAETKSRGKQCTPSVGRTCQTLLMAKEHLLEEGVQLAGVTLSLDMYHATSNSRSPSLRPSSLCFCQIRRGYQQWALSDQWPLVIAADWALLSPKGPVNNRSYMAFYSSPDNRNRVISDFGLILLTGTSGVLTKVYKERFSRLWHRDTASTAGSFKVWRATSYKIPETVRMAS